MNKNGILGVIAAVGLGALVACAQPSEGQTFGTETGELRGTRGCNPQSEGVAIEGTELLVALENGGVVALDPHNGTTLHTYATGPNAFGAAFSEDGERAFVTDKDKGTLTEIDPESNGVKTSIMIGNTPQQLAVAGDRVYVALNGEAAIAVVDVSGAPALLRKIPMGTGTKPHTLSVSPDNAKLWVASQGVDPRITSIPLTADGEGAATDYRYDIVPRVIAASNTGAFFTGHHSTGFHAIGADGRPATPFVDDPGPFSEARKQIEGAWSNASGSLVGFTHEGKKALTVLRFDAAGKPQIVREIDSLVDVPYWVTVDPSERTAYVSIPGAGVVQAWSLTSCSPKPLWAANVGGKAKRMNIKAGDR
jgi:hypothetical protein